jgi:hypothetical protein
LGASWPKLSSFPQESADLRPEERGPRWLPNPLPLISNHPHNGVLKGVIHVGVVVHRDLHGRVPHEFVKHGSASLPKCNNPEKESDGMPTYRVGNQPLLIRKSFREVLCEQCGGSIGKIHVAKVPEKTEGLSPREVLNFYPFMKVDIQIHEKECPAQKKGDGRGGQCG